MRARPLIDRLMEQWLPVTETGCWLWTGKVDRKGYARIGVRVPGRKNTVPKLAYRLLYQLLDGPIPEGLQLDHLCRVRCCVNPAHLEPVTCGENIRRGDGPGRNGINVAAAKKTARTHCKHGHEYTAENTGRAKSNGARVCLTCKRQYMSDYYAQHREGWNVPRHR